MRKTLYIIILALLLLAPVKRLNVADLEPVQTVAISVHQGMIMLETDTDNQGRGGSIEEALKDLEENTPGVIYLDTAQYLLVAESAKTQLRNLKKYLSASVKVAQWDEKSSVKDAAKYLRIRKDLPKLKSLK